MTLIAARQGTSVRVNIFPGDIISETLTRGHFYRRTDI